MCLSPHCCFNRAFYWCSLSDLEKKPYQLDILNSLSEYYAGPQATLNQTSKNNHQRQHREVWDLVIQTILTLLKNACTHIALICFLTVIQMLPLKLKSLKNWWVTEETETQRKPNMLSNYLHNSNIICRK